MLLDKFLADCGRGTRSELKRHIKNGDVRVDGEVVRDAGMRLDESRAAVELCGERVEYRKYVCLMLNKPSGVVSATEDNLHKTVLDLLPEKYSNRSLFPVGRLDIDTEGLLLITDDGALAHRLTAPRSHVPKTYFVRLERELAETDAAAFADGITLDDGCVTRPSELRALGGKTAEVVLYEGKFHQVKRMFAAVGNHVEYLKRIKMGGLTLGDLPLGAVRELTDEDMKKLTDGD